MFDDKWLKIKPTGEPVTLYYDCFIKILKTLFQTSAPWRAPPGWMLNNEEI